MSLTPTELQQYRTDGFLIVRDLFTEAELHPAIDTIEQDVGVTGPSVGR